MYALDFPATIILWTISDKNKQKNLDFEVSLLG